MSVVVPRCRYSGSTFASRSCPRRWETNESRYSNSLGSILGSHRLMDSRTLSNALMFAPDLFVRFQTNGIRAKCARLIGPGATNNFLTGDRPFRVFDHSTGLSSVQPQIRQVPGKTSCSFCFLRGGVIYLLFGASLNQR